MLKIELTNSIKHDLKQYKHQKETLLKLQKIIELLVNERNVPTKHRDHNLTATGSITENATYEMTPC